MIDHTRTRATPLRRVGCALTIALALGLGVTGSASAAAPLSPGANEIKGHVGGWPWNDTKTFTCPEGLGIQDIKTSSPHSDWVHTVLTRNGQRAGIKVYNATPWFESQWYHVTFRCEGPITDPEPPPTPPWL